MLFNFAFGINNKYSKYVRIIINSICINHPSNYLKFHILTDYISNKNIKKITKEVQQYKNAEIFIHNIDKKYFQGLYTGNWHLSTWYRVLLPEMLDTTIDRVLYLDADTIVNGDLSSLFKLNMTNNSIAGVHDLIPFAKERKEPIGISNKGKYICAGVMMMNLNFWRKNKITEKILNYARENASVLFCPDQDSINAICNESIKLLPFKYGYVREFHNKKDSIIFHYSSTYPWQTIYRPPHYLIWKKYNDRAKYPVKTTWNNFILGLKIYGYKIISAFKKI